MGNTDGQECGQGGPTAPAIMRFSMGSEAFPLPREEMAPILSLAGARISISFFFFFPEAELIVSGEMPHEFWEAPRQQHCQDPGLWGCLLLLLPAQTENIAVALLPAKGLCTPCTVSSSLLVALPGTAVHCVPYVLPLNATVLTAAC